MREEFTAVDAMTEVNLFEPDRIDEELENGRIEIALLLTATTAEAILRDELIQHLEIPRRAFDEICGDKTLGWYVSKCNEKKIIDQQYRDSFDSLVKKRGKLVHDLGYLDQLDKNDDEVEKVRSTIVDCYNWFDSRRQDS
ncbi:hypothetical protein SAMN05216226_1219 [Halovenus aranensis]|uniref:Uncharacterized protein n=1 Tax=Halovenus aranensis TaxID=890420 RepID=A0A1G8ZD38_9EURY|nr:hypothetical protein [Halovenus aranensis]SDK12981.1 hypothetical protein SAMN05216226_1219 [Halovenus aranensis]